ncbi:MAG: ribbon-helix-helix protein, CopG family [Candidatus Heimdallarchaeota archaeon]|nr:ribbon-helix-helix protein, CopG family [Candidatus Heimdallarchaeota archaeon]
MTNKLITFKVTDNMVKEMDKMLRDGNYRSRSEMVRETLAEFIGKEYYEGEIPESSVIKLKRIIS